MNSRSELEMHTRFLLARARRLARNEADAQDLVQDTCLNALEAIERLGTRPDNVRGWLVAIMHNRWFNVLRHHRVRASAWAELSIGQGYDSDLCDSRLVCSQLARAWSQLPAQAQSIAQQVLLDGDTEEDVSRRFGITRGGVASSIHRTRQQLRHAMFGAQGVPAAIRY